jgi:hypothetical protein
MKVLLKYMIPSHSTPFGKKYMTERVAKTRGFCDIRGN